MKNLYCIICGEYIKFEKPEISYLLEKTIFLVLFAVSKRMKMKNYLKKKSSILDISQGFRLNTIDETRNVFLEEIKQNELMSKKHKNVCTILNYIEHFLILPSTMTGYTSIFDFAFLICIPIGITRSAIGIQIYAITAGIKKYKLIIKEIVLLAKSRLNSIEMLISKALIDSVIRHDEFVLQL